MPICRFTLELSEEERDALNALAEADERRPGPYLRQLLREHARLAGLLPQKTPINLAARRPQTEDAAA